MPGPVERLVALVDQAGAAGLSRREAADALGLSEPTIATLARQLVGADRAYLARKRLFSTAPFTEGDP